MLALRYLYACKLSNKKRESKRCKIEYWLEDSIICMARRCLLVVIEEILSGATDNNFKTAHNDLDKVINDLQSISGFNTPIVLIINETTSDKFKEKITINELSFIFGTNRTTLCKEFKQATGTTITEYLAEKKLELAKKHIANTTATFTEISNQLNFESIHYFTRFFKKRTGLSPKEYRKKYLNKIDL